MKVYEIYFSPTGGTEKVSNILSGVWEGEKISIDLCNMDDDFSYYNIADDDICIISVPSYGGRVPVTAVERLKNINGNGAKAVIVCVYGNRAYEDTLAELKDCCVRQGFEVVSAVAAVAEHSIMRKFAKGRPDNEDKNELKEFSEKIKEKIKKGTTSHIEVPGNHIYKEFKGSSLKPEPDEKCTKCGVCRDKCPVKAINEDCTTDKDKCISCMRCVSLCPQGARNIDKIVVKGMETAMAKAFEGRKENQLFI